MVNSCKTNCFVLCRSDIATGFTSALITISGIAAPNRSHKSRPGGGKLPQKGG